MSREVAVGRVVRAHGIKGEVVVRRFGETPGVLAPGSELRFRRGSFELTLAVADARPHQRGWIVSFEGIANRTEAEHLAGTELFVDAETLPPLEEGSYYEYQILGLEVVTEDGKLLGRVEDILETGAHDVYVVRGEAGETLLPSIEQVVREVDLEAGRIRVRLLPGLVPDDESPTGKGDRKAGTASADNGGTEVG